MRKRTRNQRAIRKRDRLRRNSCRRCPFRAPSGRCLDPTIRIGRCGDWVYYLRPGKKLCRRHWVRPKDPRTPAQVQNRKRFGAASRNYSARLTDEEQDARIAAGAKQQSRPRLGQSGPLTGQQYSVHKTYATPSPRKGQNAKIPAKVAKPHKVMRTTWGPHRSIAGVAPGQRGRRLKASRRLKVATGSEAPRFQRLTQTARGRQPDRSSAALWRRKRLGAGSAQRKVCRNARRVELRRGS